MRELPMDGGMDRGVACLWKDDGFIGQTHHATNKQTNKQTNK